MTRINVLVHLLTHRCEIESYTIQHEVVQTEA